VIRADVAALPLADDSFDRAYSVNGIFFWPDPEAALAEIHRVLRSGSLAIIAGPTSAFVLARLSGVGPRTAPFGPMQVATLAERAGFESVRIGRTIGAAQILGRKG
jgi:SAM-dependent methyltransferase